MSGRGHEYIPRGGGLFSDDGDVDDDTFLRNARPKTSSPAADASGVEQILERKRLVEERIVESSSRSLGVLRDSERIGVASAEELMRQREQLENSSRRLDEINANLRFSQKHLNGIKSVFGSLKNYISGKADGKLPTQVERNETPAASQIFTPPPPPPAHTSSHPSSLHATGGSHNMNRLLEANLDEMAHSITRLKGLAVNLGEEIESQNDLIDDIHDKVEVADINIGKQNKQMNKLLGK